MKFAFQDVDMNPGEEGMLTSYTSHRTKRDVVIVLSDSLIPGWEFSLFRTATDTVMPFPGDSAFINLNKPFLAADSMTFTMIAPKIQRTKAKSELDLIRVVPNPYVVTADWEPLNPYTRGRGPRELHFINLPQKCTIRIFNVTGQLVQEIEHNALSASDATVIWDMLSKDRLEISYGIYVYHIDAGDLGSKIGKFAVIK